MSRLMIAGLVVLTMVMVSGLQAQAPEPSVAGESWKLNFTHDKPRVVRVPNEDGGYDWYWYITYKVVNKNDKDIMFLPDFTIATDKGHIIAANKGVSPLAYPVIQQQLKNPLLESPAEVVGTLKQGDDYAKQGVIIWKDFGEDVDQLSLFIAGLSGETVSIKHPTTGEDVYLRRTLVLKYDTPGNPPSPKEQAEVTTLVSETEVMR